MKPKIIVLLVIIALSLVVIIQNTQVVTYRLFIWKISISQIILLPFAVLTGFAIGFIVAKLTENRREKRVSDEG